MEHGFQQEDTGEIWKSSRVDNWNRRRETGVSMMINYFSQS